MKILWKILLHACDEEPVLVETVVKSISEDYLFSLIKGNAKLSELGVGMKDMVILGLCSEFRVNP
jgi:hypothetical protein